MASAALLAGCGAMPAAPSKKPPPLQAPAPISAKKPAPAAVPALPAAKSGRGGYYQDDGPGDQPPPGLQDIPDAEPKVEPYSKSGNRPYVVFGKTYTPITDDREFSQRGIGSWYGKKFHGQKTSSGELYDMYKMTAAHPVLPIPSYARVTNLKNGQQIIVRVNDRGPFHSDRIIDLSYTAALKLGYLGSGSSELLVERLLPGEIERIARTAKTTPTPPSEQPQLVTPLLPASPAFNRAADIPAAMPNTHVQDVARMMTVDIAVAEPLKTPAAIAAADERPGPNQAVPVVPAAKGIYLQIGAYAHIANAEAARNRLSEYKKNALPALDLEHSEGGLYRLYCGPFATAAQAADAAQQLQENGFSKPVLVQRQLAPAGRSAAPGSGNPP